MIWFQSKGKLMIHGYSNIEIKRLNRINISEEKRSLYYVLWKQNNSYSYIKNLKSKLNDD